MRRSTLPLSLQLLVLQVVIVLITVAAAGALAVHLQERQIRETYQQRVLSTATSVAALPSVVEAYAEPDPAVTIAPLAELVRRSSGMTFVVLTDRAGVRYSHPDAARIGEVVSTDMRPVLSGTAFVGTETGTLGESLRAKVPVRDASGAVIGVASVGVLESRLTRDLRDDVPVLVAWLSGAALLGTLGSLLLARTLRRRIFGLEPEEIARLLETREAMLHGIAEGVLAVGDDGRVELANDEGVRLLGLVDDPTGRRADEVLDATLLALLATGAAVVDEPVLSGERLLVANRTTATVDGRRVAHVLTLRDRTELSAAVRELDGQRSITSALRAQAHEFRNQLHVVAGLVELGKPQEAMAYVERVAGGQPLGGRLVGGLPAAADPGVVALLIAKAAEARERGVSLDLAPLSDVADGLGPDDDLVTVIGNLVDNALDATRPGGSIEVLVTTEAGGAVLVRVDDDGPGVPAASRTRVFEAGVSSKRPLRSGSGEDAGGPGAEGGSAGRAAARGLGLALVGRVATRRGGSARIATSPLGGARVEVRLEPAQREHRVPAGFS